MKIQNEWLHISYEHKSKLAWNYNSSYKEGNQTIVAGDGQVSLGNTVLKSKAKKVRKIEKRNVIAGFAGSTADALTLFERLEAKLEKHAGNLTRAAVELAKDWRTDKYLRRLEGINGSSR